MPFIARNNFKYKINNLIFYFIDLFKNNNKQQQKMLSNKHKSTILLISLMLLLELCSVLSISKKNLKTNNSSKSTTKQDSILNLSPYKYPKNKKSNREVTIAILGTNDIHGQAYEKEIVSDEDIIKVGGFKLLSGVINKMRSEFPGRFLWLDAGDQFTGTVEKERTDGKLMIDFYNLMKVDSVAIGNHEWDKKELKAREWMTAELGAYHDGVNNLWSQQAYGKDNKNLYLAANLKMKEGLIDDLPNRMPTKIFSFENGKIKIGVIGLTTLETVAKTAAFPKERFDILDYKEVVENASKRLRKDGCQAVIIVSHVGTNCKKPTISPEDLEDLYELKLRNKKAQAAEKCDGEIADLLKAIDQRFVDGVVAGHIHEAVHHFFNEIPVIQNPMSNLFTNLIYLKFRRNWSGQYRLVKGESLIEGPIPLCSKVYSNNKRCNQFQPLSEEIELLEYTFHGSKLFSDPKVEELFDVKYKDLTEKIQAMKKDVIFETEVLLERNVKKENLLGNLIADLIRKATNSDIAVNTPGSLRYVWDIGFVSEYELNNMFPFGGNFGKRKMKGDLVLNMIKKIQTEGKMGYLYNFSGVKMTLIKSATGKYNLDEEKLVLEDGSKIDPEKEYTVGGMTFFLDGGDDMKFLKDEGKLGDNPITDKVNILKTIKVELKNLKIFTAKEAEKMLGRMNIVYPEQH